MPEYRIVNLAERVLDVYRESGPDARAVYGWVYRRPVRLGPEEHVAPSVAPASRIRVSDLLP